MKKIKISFIFFIRNKRNWWVFQKFELFQSSIISRRTSIALGSMITKFQHGIKSTSFKRLPYWKFSKKSITINCFLKFSSGALSDNPYQGANWVSFCPSKLSNLIYLRSFRDHISLYKIDNQFFRFNNNFGQFYKIIPVCNLEKTSLTKFQFIFLFCKFMSEFEAHIFGMKFPAPILLKIFMKKKTWSRMVPFLLNLKLKLPCIFRVKYYS